MERKKVAIVLAVLMIIFFAFSIFFFAHEADHDCIGENCPICEQIAVCQKTFEEFGMCVLTTLLLIAFVFSVVKILGIIKNRSSKHNLVTLKIVMLT